MGKSIVSVKLSGPLANDIMDQEIRKLCDDYGVDYNEFYETVGIAPDILVINEALEKSFPGELKIIA